MSAQERVTASNCKQRYFDAAALREIVDTFPRAAAADLLDRFARELPLHAAAIRQAHASADLATLFRRLHTMRGTSLAFGCTGLSTICDVVQASAASNDPAECPRMVDLLTAANATALSELDAPMAAGGLR